MNKIDIMHQIFSLSLNDLQSQNTQKNARRAARKGTDTSPLEDSLRLHQSLFCSVFLVGAQEKGQTRLRSKTRCACVSPFFAQFRGRAISVGDVFKGIL